MADLLTAFVPLFAFMLIPVWIPIVAHVGGAIVDRLARPDMSATARAVEAAKTRSADLRATPRHVPRHRFEPVDVIAA